MLRRRPIMRMAATTAVVAGTATAVSGGVARHQAAKAQAAAPPPEPEVQYVAAPEPVEDTYEQLTKLGALHEQGILTDEEFSAQKAKILG